MPLSNKRFWICGAIAMVVTAAVVGLLWATNQKKLSESRAETHATVRTRMDIQSAFLALQCYASDNGVLPQPLFSPRGAAQDARSLYAILFVVEQKPTIGHLPSHWREAQSIIDRWGNPLNFQIEPKGDAESYLIKIWSNGPNGRDEDGKGDDISMDSFRMSVRGAHE